MVKTSALGRPAWSATEGRACATATRVAHATRARAQSSVKNRRAVNFGHVAPPPFFLQAHHKTRYDLPACAVPTMCAGWRYYLPPCWRISRSRAASMPRSRVGSQLGSCQFFAFEIVLFFFWKDNQLLRRSSPAFSSFSFFSCVHAVDEHMS